MYSIIGLFILVFFNVYWLSVNKFYNLDNCTIYKPPKGVCLGVNWHIQILSTRHLMWKNIYQNLGS
jgi:hypothetical protein